jgi:hypothetical protein
MAATSASRIDAWRASALDRVAIVIDADRAPLTTWARAFFERHPLLRDGVSLAR